MAYQNVNLTNKKDTSQIKAFVYQKWQMISLLPKATKFWSHDQQKMLTSVPTVLNGPFARSKFWIEERLSELTDI